MSDGEHDARLNTGPRGVDHQDAAKVSREIDHQPAAERLAGQPGAGPAGMNREMVFGGVPHGGDDVLDVARPHDAQRPQLVDARVAGVELREQVVAANFALHEAAKILFNSLALCVHQFDCSAD